ncbi:aldo/keto reductase [Pantoea sp. C8B4]|uniref:aldo/keto reductase n=1 Tax=Pantoea sp. C8B4 TaxID=3243083 RepID=UPI003ED91C8E
MQYVRFGRSGLRASRYTLGAMTFGSGEGIWSSIAGLSVDEAKRIISVALENGINLVDSADVYSQGQSETVLGQALKALQVDESKMMVATKVRLRTGSGPNEVGLGRSHIIRTVEKSLKRLQRDHIDLLQLHDRDNLTPLDETLRALDDLVTQGKVRHIGACNFSAAEMVLADGFSQQYGKARFTSNQVHYSLACRDIEFDVAKAAQQGDHALMIWSPLSGGYLSGKYAMKHEDDKQQGRRSKLNFPPVDVARVDPIVDELIAIGREMGCSAATVAHAWLLSRAEVTTVIIGAKNEQQLLQNLEAQTLVLSDEQLQKLNILSQPAIPYPYWMQLFHDKDRI